MQHHSLDAQTKEQTEAADRLGDLLANGRWREAPLKELTAGASLRESGSRTLLMLAAASAAECAGAMLEAGQAEVALTDASGWTALHNAAAAGSWDSAQRLLQAGADANAANDDGWTPLAEAVRRNDVRTIDVLMRNGADAERPAAGADGKTPLQLADAFGLAAAVRLLMQGPQCQRLCAAIRERRLDERVMRDNAAGAWLLQVGERPLLVAVQRRSPGAVRLLLRSSRLVLHYLREHRRLWQLVAEANDTAIVQLLQRNGYVFCVEMSAFLQQEEGACDAVRQIAAAALHAEEIIHHTDDDEQPVQCQGRGVNSWCLGRTPLMHAAQDWSSTSDLLLLLSAGADANLAGKDGCTPLMLAAAEDNAEAVKILLGNGADAACRNYSRQTALQVAEESGSWEAARMLAAAPISVGRRLWDLVCRGHLEQVKAEATSANCGRTDEEGVTLLMAAADCRLPDADARVQLLSGLGCDSLAADNFGWTAAHYAARSGHCSVRSLRIVGGNSAEVDAGNVKWETPLMLAAAGGKLRPLRRLLRLGADPMRRDIDGSTPMHLAAMYGRTAALQPLLEAGAQLEAADNCLDTPLTAGVQFNCPADTARQLLLLGANVHHVSPLQFERRYGNALTSAATYRGCGADVASCLLQAGIDASEHESLAWTFAVRLNYLPLARALLRGGADIRDAGGRADAESLGRRFDLDFGSAALGDKAKLVLDALKAMRLCTAIADGNLDDQLLQENAAGTGSWFLGVTPLMAAAQHPGADAQLLQRLLDAGSDVNEVGKDDCTPLMAAAGANRVDTVQWLLQRGADCRQTNCRGETALQLADAAGCDAELLQLLRDAAASDKEKLPSN